MTMADREYRVVVAATRSGLDVAADGGWAILASTVREFARLETNDDLSLGDIGAVTVQGAGFVALAFREIA
jgi:hypothetical protein